MAQLHGRIKVGSGHALRCKVGPVPFCPGLASPGSSGLGSPGYPGRGYARHGVAVTAVLGMSRCSNARCGRLRPSEARPVPSRQGKAVMAVPGLACPGLSWSVGPWQFTADRGSSEQVKAVVEWLVGAMLGVAWHGVAKQGSQGTARRGRFRIGSTGLGMAQQGKAGMASDRSETMRLVSRCRRQPPSAFLSLPDLEPSGRTVMSYSVSPIPSPATMLSTSKIAEATSRSRCGSLTGIAAK